MCGDAEIEATAPAWEEGAREAFDRAVIQNTPNALIACDADARLVMFNPAAVEWHGLDALNVPAEEWAQHYRLFMPDGITPFPAEEIPLTRAYHGERVQDVPMVIRAAGQPLRRVSASGAPFFDEAGQRIGAFVVLVDTTQRESATQALREREGLLASMVDEAPLPMMVHTEDGKVLQINKAWEQGAGFSANELPTVDVWLEKAFGERAAQVKPEFERLYGMTGRCENGEWVLRTAKGEQRVWDFHSAPLGVEADGRRTVLTMARDVTEVRKLTAELQHLATHDALTDLPNRRAFEDEVRRAVEFAKRGLTSTLLFADVDGFKTCNDTFGHEFGDQVLREIAVTLRQTVRDVDFVGRIGGDEFGILLWDMGSVPAAHACKRLSRAVEQVGRNHQLRIGLSIGAARIEAGVDASDVLAEADGRMYDAKSSRQSCLEPAHRERTHNAPHASA